MVGPDGVFRGHVGTVTDITHQKAVQDALRAGEMQLRLAKEEAERANLAKSKFLAAASHDLRQPLQAANLFMAALQNRVNEEERRFVLDKLQQSLSALENLFNALLDVSKLEAGVSQPTQSIFPVGELFIQLASEFAPRAAGAALALPGGAGFGLSAHRSVVPGAHPAQPRSQRGRLHRAGRILLGARRRGRHLRIEVWDTGIGIPADKQEEIFDDFSQPATRPAPRAAWASASPSSSASPGCSTAGSSSAPGRARARSSPATSLWSPPGARKPRPPPPSPGQAPSEGPGQADRRHRR